MEALRNNEGIGLILLDIDLPDMDGRELIRKIRESNTRMPIIVQTALASPNDKESTLAAGADEYLTKPIDRDVLFDKIEKYLGGK